MSKVQHDRTQEYSATLRNAALRVTKQRVAVLHAVDSHPHADTETVIEAVRRHLPEVSHQAVYDSLHTLTEVELLRRIQPSGSVARYERRVGDNHHHLVCRLCNVIVDVECATGEAPCLGVKDDHGFSIEHAEVTFWGLCPDCSRDSQESDLTHPSPTVETFEVQSG